MGMERLRQEGVVRGRVQRIIFSFLCASFVGLFPCGICRAADASDWTEEDRALTSLEDLVYMNVTSVSKRDQKLSESAAAIFVITQEDIQRMGAVSIAEALRIVPGMQVTNITTDTYAISTRGLNSIFADKLLVLIDGRSVYTPTFGGVFWGVQDTMMEDIDRIEVIRGPGATLWGANAVNGVINIITKKAEDTQGGLLVAGAGTQETAFSSVRYGGEAKIAGNAAYYRVYGKLKKRHEGINPDRSDGPDDSQAGRVGFRMDWNNSGGDSFTVQGDAYKGKQGFGYNAPTSLTSEPDTDLNGEDEWDVSGGNLLGRWTRKISESNSLTLQSYYDRADRDSVLLGIKRDTFDLDFQHRFEWIDHNYLTWGLGYRVTHDQMDNKAALLFDPESKTDNLFSGFIQNETSLLDDKLRITLGSKIERNDYTGWEFQPSARAAYVISDNQSVWTSVSRALQTRSRVDDVAVVGQVIALNSDPPFNLQINGMAIGDDKRPAQRLYAFELGYRLRPLENVSLDLAAYQNEYKGLVDIDDIANIVPVPKPDPPATPTYIAVPAQYFGDHIHGHIRGVELAANWQVLESWRLGAGFAYARGDFEDRTGGGTGDEQNGHPRHQYHIRSYMDLPAGFDLDSVLYFVGKAADARVPSYYRLDLRLGWKVCEDVELSLVGQNLLQHRRQEWYDELGGLFKHTDVSRSVYGKINWTF